MQPNSELNLNTVLILNLILSSIYVLYIWIRIPLFPFLCLSFLFPFIFFLNSEVNQTWFWIHFCISYVYFFPFCLICPFQPWDDNPNWLLYLFGLKPPVLGPRPSHLCRASPVPSQGSHTQCGGLRCCHERLRFAAAGGRPTFPGLRSSAAKFSWDNLEIIHHVTIYYNHTSHRIIHLCTFLELQDHLASILSNSFFSG